MLQSFFNGLSGLFSYSRGLQTISNNVANMNTAGFRGSDNFFRNVSGYGLGTELSGTGLRMQGGEFRQTGGPTDLALNGGGFFVLKDAQGNVFYTRAGQFAFDKDGILVDKISKAHVQGLNASGMLTDITIANVKTLPPQATTNVVIKGNLLPPTTTPAQPATISFTVFDSAGGSHALTASFTYTATPTSPATNWKCEIKDATGNVIGNSDLGFASGGILTSGGTIAAQLTVNGSPFAFTVDLSSAPGVTAQTGLPASLSIGSVNGFAPPTLLTSSLTFDEKGILQLEYSNGEKKTGPQIALASFADESQLQYAEGSMFRSTGDAPATYGRAGEGAFGKVKGGGLELSNVDLTQEFADMLIYQRGYQASSRVMSVSNEMIEQLYNSSRGG